MAFMDAPAAEKPVVSGPAVETDYKDLDVACPVCKAAKDQECRWVLDGYVHLDRFNAAANQIDF